MHTQFFYQLTPLHCGGIHLSDQMIVNVVLVSLAGVLMAVMGWALSRRSGAGRP